MLWEFDFESDEPLYRQIRNQVVLSISRGELCPGDRLPTIRALSDESGINMMTVSKAYQLLKTEGYVRTDRRSGTIVARNIQETAVPPGTVEQMRLIFAELRLLGMKDTQILRLCDTILKEEKAND